MNTRLHFFAFLIQLMSFVGDWAGMKAARGWHPQLAFVISLLTFSACAPIWFVIMRITGGRFAPASVACGLSGAVLTLTLGILSGDKQNALQWLSLGLSIIAVALRVLADE